MSIFLSIAPAVLFSFYDGRELEYDKAYNVIPLGRGSLRNKPFEEGGGYKINFGGDAIFQYHPAEKSHHGGAYWKIHQGKVEHRYDMAGNEKQDG